MPAKKPTPAETDKNHEIKNKRQALSDLKRFK